MARRKSENKMTTAERLISLRQEIEEAQKQLISLKEKEKQIIKLKQKEDLDALLETITTSGLSIADAQNLIKSAAGEKNMTDTDNIKTA